MKPLALVLDGELIPHDKPAFLPTERGLLYGDGLFETIAVYGSKPLNLHLHRKRIEHSCRQLGFPDLPPWEEPIAMCLRAAGPSAGAVRVTWTTGAAAARGYRRSEEDGPPHLLVAAFEPAPSRSEGVHAVTVHGLEPGSLAEHKTTSGLNYVLAASEARSRGADEAILVDRNGRVLEASSSNIFVVTREGTVTPLWTRQYFAGLTMRQIRYRYGVSDGEISVEELRDAEEVFLSNVLAWATPVLSVDGKEIGDGTPGRRTRLVQKADHEFRTGSAQRQS